MLFFPEIRLKKICDALFKFLRSDLKECIKNNKENESHLYLLFHKEITDTTVSTNYIQAKEIFLREKDNSRYVEIYPVFDKRRAALPTVYITIPQDSEELIELGDIEGEQYEEVLNQKLERGFMTNFGLITVSDNINEVLIINYVLRALLLGSIGSLQAMGFITPKFSVQELSALADILPANAYSKGLLMTASYIEVVPEIGVVDKVNKVIFDINEIIY